MHRTMVSIGPTGTADIYELTGDLVELRDKNSPAGVANYVRTAGDWIYQLTPDWHATRWESLAKAAESLEVVASSLIAQAETLRANAEKAKQDLQGGS